MKNIIRAPQGSPDWHAHRAAHYNASEAAAMLGLDPHKSRSQLLAEKAAGITPEVDAATQARFDRGHEYEAIARPWAEEIIGEELYPVVLAHEEDGLPLGASLDGLTMLEDVAFEHKTLNQELDAALAEGVIPARYHPQMEQQLLVSGATRCLFMASNGDKATMRHAWYESDPEVRARLIAGWNQFHADRLTYEHKPEAPAPEGKAPETLPALRIEVQGMVTASNLEEFRARALTVIGAVNTDLQTDEDFANAEKAVKWCGEVEKRLDAAKEHALSQTASIDELFRTLDQIKAEARTKRLDLDKLVKARKESVREEIRVAAVNALREHYATINATLGGRVELGIPAAFGPDVGAAMKGKKTIASLRDAADTALAHAKMDANAQADRVRLNLQALESAPAHLFPDAATLATTKAPEDLKALITARIAEHQAAEEKRLEAERARIRAEEEARAQREAAKAAQQAAPEAPRAQPARIEPKPRPGRPTDAAIIRPTDAAIIEVLALHYRAHESKVIAWLLDMDLDAESRKLAASM